MTTEEWLTDVKSRRYSRQDLERMVAEDKAVIEAFYDELRRLGIMPLAFPPRPILTRCLGQREDDAVKAVESKGGKKGGPARAAK